MGSSSIGSRCWARRSRRSSKECRHVRLDDFAHRVSGQLGDAGKTFWNLVGREAGPRPFLEVVELQRYSGPQLRGAAYALAPFHILHADNDSLGNSGVCAPDFFDFQRGNLVAAALQDVHAGSSEKTVGTVLDDRVIASAKPSVDKRFARAVGLSPVLGE